MNVFTFSGNLGRDAETRYTQQGKPVTGFTVAVTSGFGDNQKTTWVSCNAWGERYEKIAQYLTKGKRVTVSGELSDREYNGKTYIEVRVNDLDLPPRTESASAPAQSRAAPNAAPAGEQTAGNNSGGDFYDEDCPFSNYEYRTLV